MVVLGKRGFFTILEGVTLKAKPLRRRIWVILCGFAAVGVVVLAWRVPEPQTHTPDRRQVENVSYMQCAQHAPVPSYGARTLDNCIR